MIFWSFEGDLPPRIFITFSEKATYKTGKKSQHLDGLSSHRLFVL